MLLPNPISPKATLTWFSLTVSMMGVFFGYIGRAASSLEHSPPTANLSSLIARLTLDNHWHRCSSRQEIIWVPKRWKSFIFRPLSSAFFHVSHIIIGAGPHQDSMSCQFPNLLYPINYVCMRACMCVCICSSSSSLLSKRMRFDRRRRFRRARLSFYHVALLLLSSFLEIPLGSWPVTFLQ